jgi:hypothetical protein
LSFSLVVLMLRFGIPVDVWMRQPDGVIETAIRLVNEQDQADREKQDDGDDGDDGRAGAGPQMSG